jgi:hypothetical protein
VTGSTVRVLRIAGALAVLLGGAIHLQQWARIYRDIPIGPTFLLNVLASVAVGTALLALDHDRWPVVAGVALSAASIVALLASRTVGLLGFLESGYDTPAVEAIVVEAIALLALGTCLVLGRNHRPETVVGSEGSRPVGRPA